MHAKNMKITLFAMGYFLLGFSLNAQLFTGGTVYGTSNGASTRNYVVDSLGNSIFCGRYNDTLHFDSFQLACVGFTDVFVAKRNPQGNILWALSFGGPKIDDNFGLTVDSQGNVYLCGYITDSAYVAGVPIISTSTGLNSSPEVGYVVKLDPFGNLVWLQTYEPIQGTGSTGLSAWDVSIGPHGDVYLHGTLVGNFQMGSFNVNTNGGIRQFLAKLSGVDGTFEWVNAYTGDGHPLDMAASPDGKIFTLSRFTNSTQLGGVNVNAAVPGQTSGERFLAQWDTLGNLLWSKHLYTTYTFPYSFSACEVEKISASGPDGVAIGGTFHGNLYLDNQLLGSTIGPKPTGIVMRFDGSGNLLWSDVPVGPARLQGMTSNASGEVFICGYPGTVTDSITFGGNLVLDTYSNFDRFFTKYAANGQGLWANTLVATQYAGSTLNFDDLQTGLNHELYAFGETNFDTILLPLDTLLLEGPFDLVWISMEDTLVPTPPANNVISGTVFRDDNLNCLFDTNEVPLSQIWVQATPGPYLGITDSLGNYEIQVPPGTFSVSQVIPNIPGLVMDTVCPVPANYSLTFSGNGQSASGFDFGDTLTNCHYLELNLTANRKRICANSSSWIHYTNKGRDTAKNAYLTLEFDPFLKPDNASLPWQAIDTAHWVIPLGDIPPNFAGSVRIDDYIPCFFLSFGLTPCMRVEIFPRNRCALPDPNWSQAELSLQSSCVLRDTVEFLITNSGTGNMTDSVTWELYLDAALADSGKVKLDTGQQVVLVVPTSGQTAYMRLDQVLYFPDETWMARVEEGCGLGDTAFTISLGYVPQIPLVDWRKRTEKIICQEIVYSFDPNDKQATPVGITPAHIVPPDTRLNYQVRFQNTGTDTAFKVVIRDTLPGALDLSTLQLEGASHPYFYAIEGGNPAVLVFTFDPIILPDSNVNVEASQGFVKFAANLKPSTPLGTVLQNQAAIYFDLNSPVITNTVMHTVDTLKVRNLQNNLVESYGPLAAAQTMPDTVFCLTDSLSISALWPTIGQGHWSIVQGAGNISDPLAAQTWLLNADTGHYEILWQVTDGPLFVNDTLQLEILPVPEQPVIFAQGDSLFVDTDAFFFQWFLDGVQLDQVDSVLAPAIAGNYTVQVYYTPECPSTLSEGFIWSSSSLEDDLTQELQVFPNPSNGNLRVWVPELKSTGRLHVYALSGQEVWHGPVLPPGTETHYDLHIKGLPDGLYYLRLQPQNLGAMIRISSP